MNLKLKKIEIKNFKSIEYLELDIEKHGGSYTAMLTGLNESGKSNLLEALSFLSLKQDSLGEYHFENCKNNRLDQETVEVRFYFHLPSPQEYLDPIRQYCKNEELLDFEFSKIQKTVILEEGEKSVQFEYKLNLKKTPYIRVQRVPHPEEEDETVEGRELAEEPEDSSFTLLEESNFNDFFSNKFLFLILGDFSSQCSFWKSSSSYYLSEVDLNSFKENPESNIPLKNIFHLSGYETPEKIAEVVEKSLNDHSRKIALETKLSRKATEYIGKRWKTHPIEIYIRIESTGMCTPTIKNISEEDEYHEKMESRSTGARHFLSVLLSLSIECHNQERNGELILLDEPESHLHPSAIRDLRKELIKMGEENYVFAATHSPFLIDKENPSRNIIVKKNKKSLTEIKRLCPEQNAIDEEVLREAFGMSVYRDLLNPHSLLLEGACDKMIVDKGLNALNKKGFGTTNGHGDNLETLVSKMNHDDISLLVLVDDDKKGKAYKNKIIKIKGNFSKENVFTLRDLNGNLPDGATIEDCLNLKFIQRTFSNLEGLSSQKGDINLESSQPVLKQIKEYLNRQFPQESEKKKKIHILEELKKELSEKLELSQSSLQKNHPELFTLIQKIIGKLEPESDQPDRSSS